MASKRRQSSASISPPPLRRKLTHDPAADASISSTSTTTTTTFPIPPTIKIDSNEKDIKQRFEILSWNVNGISHLLPPSQKPITSFFSPRSREVSPDTTHISPLRAFLARHDFPQIICLQEVKIASQDTKTQHAAQRAANPASDNDTGPSYTCHFCLPRDRFNARGLGGNGKVYGVCTFIRTDITSPSPSPCPCPSRQTAEKIEATTREVAWDTEGRVLLTELISTSTTAPHQQHFSLAIINSYWVNGTSAPYRSPLTGAVTGTRHDRKRAFHHLMLEEVKACEGKGYEAVLVGDMNVARSRIDGFPGLRMGSEHVRNREEFNALFFEDAEGMRGVDSFRWVHGGRKAFTYHGERKEEWGCSCDRVDLAIVSRGLVDAGALVGAEIWETVEERGGSDHVPISVVLDLEKLEPEARLMG